MGWFGKKKDAKGTKETEGDATKLSPREQAAAEFKNTVGVVYAIAIINGVLGVLSFLITLDPRWDGGFGIGLLIAGVIYGALGFWIQREKSTLGLGIALGIYIADSLAFLVGAIESGATRPPIAMAGLRISFIYLMFQGFGAIKQLKSAQITNEENDDQNDSPSDFL